MATRADAAGRAATIACEAGTLVRWPGSRNGSSGSQPTLSDRPAPPDNQIYESIGNHDEARQGELGRLGKRRRIDGGNDVVLDESAGVVRAARCKAQGVLQWREWTDSTRNLDEHAPDDSWKVEQRRPAPAESEEPTGHDKQDEREMEDEDEIGENAVEHDDRPDTLDQQVEWKRPPTAADRWSSL